MSTNNNLPLYKEEVIQLVTVKKGGSLEITTQAINFLNSLQNTKIAILSIVGPTKTGKTLLANEIIKKQNGFTSESTKGLYLWGVPFDLDKGTKLLIIDSQGLSKNEPDLLGQKLFELVLLISTCVIYNSNGAINDEVLSNLIYFTDLTNKINVEPDKPENKSLNSIDNLSLYFPDFIWALRDYNTQNEANVYMEECLNNNPKSEKIKKLFKCRKCFAFPNSIKDNQPNPEFSKKVNEMYKKIKCNIKTKNINNFEIDGESLFGLLQNYLDSMNNDENPIISLSLGNVLLSKAKNISEKNFESFKTGLIQSFESKYPMSYLEIYRQFLEAQDKEIEKFCRDIENMLTVKQTGNYIVKLNERMRTELENIFETNDVYYNDWFDIEYKELEKTLSVQKLEKLDDIEQFLISYTNDLLKAFKNFLNIPNSEFCKNLILFLIKIIQDHIVTKLQKIGESITALINNYKSDYSNLSNKLNVVNSSVKTLSDQLASEKKLLEEKNKEKSELNKQFLKLETKYDALTREFKAKENEYSNNINIEVQKFQKMENSYKTQINDKDQEIIQLKAKIDKLNKDIAEMSKENSDKTKELSRENLKLQVEIERKKEKEKRGKSELPENRTVNFQLLFNSIQSTFMEFKESLDKLGKESEKVNSKNFESEFESKLKEWMEGIERFKTSCEHQIKKMNESHEKTIKKIVDEAEELKLELMKKNYSLEEQKISKQENEKKLQESKELIEEMRTISKSREQVIESQEETIKMLDDNIKGLTKTKEDLEINLTKNIVNYKMKEDELETLVMVIEGMLSKKRDKYEHNVTRLSNEIKNTIEILVKQYKLFK